MSGLSSRDSSVGRAADCSIPMLFNGTLPVPGSIPGREKKTFALLVQWKNVWLLCSIFTIANTKKSLVRTQHGATNSI